MPVCIFAHRWFVCLINSLKNIFKDGRVSPGYWILGVTFLKHFYAVFDQEKSRVGFADSRILFVACLSLILNFIFQFKMQLWINSYLFSPKSFTSGFSIRNVPTTPSNCFVAGEGQGNNPTYCLAFFDKNSQNSDELDCCWTANHLSEIPEELADFVSIRNNDTMWVFFALYAFIYFFYIQ